MKIDSDDNTYNTTTHTQTHTLQHFNSDTPSSHTYCSMSPYRLARSQLNCDDTCRPGPAAAAAAGASSARAVHTSARAVHRNVLGTS